MIELDELEEPEAARAQLRDFGLMGPHKYAGVKDPKVARRLLTAIHPSL